LVVGAVVLGGKQIEGLTDSKKLSKKRREELDIAIREQAAGFGLGWVEASEIDDIGLSVALVLATKRAVEQVKAAYHEIIIDGTVNFLAGTNKGQYVKTMKKADLLVPSVSAASIIAKVARDRFMAQQDIKHPGYGFGKHVGYGTAIHSKAIDKLGVTPLHRLSFAPLKKYAKPKKIVDGATTKQIGDSAEDVASYYLMRHSHEILDRNWKTKYCEIDIVSKLKDMVYFTEVKYRKTDAQGGGLDAVNRKKLNQMKFAARFYAMTNKISDMNLRLAVISLSGESPEVIDFLEV